MKVKINAAKVTKKLNKVWNFGVNTCHAKLWTRDDLPRHAKIAAELCGFRYVRFHNTISEHLNIYDEDKDGNPVINFDIFDKVYDKVIQCGYLPFFEVGFCPPAMSQHTRSLCYYRADPSVPKSFEKWSFLIEKIIEHIISRYGKSCAEKWYFEVWNEPDLFYDGTMEDYFKLYECTARAIKNVNSRLRVGGPATSKCLWIKDFIEFVNANNVPCDFISTHAYPSDLPFLDSDIGTVNLENSGLMYKLFSDVRNTMDSLGFEDKPLIMGEWNSSAGPLAENHDEMNNAAFIVKIFDDVKDIIDGSLYWALSDIYEEQGFHYEPFHGGYGLINVNGVIKSSFNAFMLLNKLGDNELSLEYTDKAGSAGAIAASDGENIQIILYNYCEPDCRDKKDVQMEITVEGIEQETVCCSIEGVTKDTGSAYEWWKAAGSPQFPDLDALEFLNKKSETVKTSCIKFTDGNNKYIFNENLSAGEIKLLRIGLQ